MTQQKPIQLGTMRLQVRTLASLSGLRIRCCHELQCRKDLALLWLWLEAAGLIRPLAWGLPYAMGAALKEQKTKKKSKKTKDRRPSMEPPLPAHPNPGLLFTLARASEWPPG